MDTIHKTVIIVVLVAFAVLCFWSWWPTQAEVVPPEGITCNTEVTQRFRSLFFGPTYWCATDFGHVSWTLEE